MAIKSDIIKKYNFLDYRDIPHDALYWKMATLYDQAYILNLPLISYRIHNLNASAPSTNSMPQIKTARNRIKEILIIKNQLEKIIKLCECKLEQKKYRLLQECFEFIEWRLSLFNEGNAINKIIHNIKYFKFYNGIRMLLGDVIAIMNCTKGERK